jgi:3-oxoadipate enol-lactonase
MSFAVASDGTHLHYDLAGKRDGTPVLMIQGLGVDSRGWALQRPRLGRRHRLLLFDNRGVGRSECPPGPYDLIVMAEDAIACLDSAGIESAHVIGASMGGVIAQILGVLHPERVRSLTLACTACRHHHWRRELLEEWANDVSAHGMRALVSSEGMHWLIGPRLQRRFGAFINILSPLVLQTKPQAFAAQVRAILAMSDSMRDDLHLITAPTLVITGTQDSLTPVGDAEEMHELIASSRLVLLSGAAHGLMAETPIAFNEAVSSFLDEVDAAAAARDDAERSHCA